MIKSSAQLSYKNVATYSDGAFVEIFIANRKPSNGHLETIEFYEDRPDLGEIKKLKTVPWDVMMPENAELIIAAAGKPRNQLNSFWAAWREQDRYSAMSIFQEKAIELKLDPAAELVYPPIALPSKKFQQLFWQETNNTWKLSSAMFSGVLGQKGEVRVTKLTSAKTQPLVSVSAPVPAENEDLSVVAWAEADLKGSIASVALIHQESLKLFSCKKVEGLFPLVPQRVGVHVNPMGLVVFGFVAFDIAQAEYKLVESYNNLETGECEIQTEKLALAPKSVVSAGVFYYMDTDEVSKFIFVNNNKQELLSVIRGTPHLYRKDVQPDYDYPIVATILSRYEAIMRKDKIDMTGIDSPE